MGGIAVVSYTIPRTDQPGARQVFDVAAGMVCNIMRQFCGLDFRALEISFPYPKPADLTPYRHLPTDRMRFGTNSLELYLESVVLDKPLPGGRSDELKLVLDDYFSAHGEPASTSQRVEDMIRRLLPTGECTLPTVAETLSTTVRTLQAHLDEEGSSFRQILENVRREIAVYHLRRGDMQLTQLAMVLGYSELSAFSRSFRSWYGVSPRRWASQGDWRA